MVIPTFLLVYGSTICVPPCLPPLSCVWPRFSLGEWHRLSESFPRYLSAEEAREMQRVADDSMAAYCILSQDAVANNLLLWPSRPKFHVSWMNVFLNSQCDKIETQHARVNLTIWDIYSNLSTPKAWQEINLMQCSIRILSLYGYPNSLITGWPP